METTIVREVSVNYRAAVQMSETLSHPGQVAEAFRSILPDNSREHFMALYLSGAHRIIAYSIVSTGTALAAPAHPREVYQRAVLVGSASIIIGHNHPSGAVDPSREDKQVTSGLKAAGELLGIKLLDHLIITDFEHYSFHGNGQL
jgi:DNA repair protein RadC